MKSIVVIYAGNNESFQFDKVFGGQSAFGRCLSWADGISEAQSVLILTVPEQKANVEHELGLFRSSTGKTFNVLDRKNWTVLNLLQEMAASCAASNSDSVIYAWGSCPFLDSALTNDVISSHEKYLSEYTYADGYPYGFAPEVLASGAVNILMSLAAGARSAEGACNVSEHSIFNVMRSDINSFEIETVIAPKDFRSYRLYFSTRTKLEFLSCVELYNAAVKNNSSFTADSLTLTAIQNPAVMQTVPAFYNVQICPFVNARHKYSPYVNAYVRKYGKNPVDMESGAVKMNLEAFNSLLAQIHELSDEAVISLSAWGEPLLLPDFAEYVRSALKYDGFTLLVETDGFKVTPQLVSELSDVIKQSPSRRNGKDAITWIVMLDAFTKEMHGTMYGIAEDGLEKSPFEKAKDAVNVLEAEFPGCVYPQFLRVKENEGELESFYRYWHDEASPSKGKLIIQKYDSFCGLMPDEKPADLSPVERNACWHLKRDMVILADGSVPSCREMLFDGSMGNVFEQDLGKIWSGSRSLLEMQLKGCLNEKCRACDEYYTFNF